MNTVYVNCVKKAEHAPKINKKGGANFAKSKYETWARTFEIAKQAAGWA